MLLFHYFYSVNDTSVSLSGASLCWSFIRLEFLLGSRLSQEMQLTTETHKKSVFQSYQVSLIAIQLILI